MGTVRVVAAVYTAVATVLVIVGTPIGVHGALPIVGTYLEPW